ncbi:MAG: glutamate synthase large subunit, partial [Pseudomonadota bacterium]
LASVGARSIEDVIGRADMLQQASRGSDLLDDFDLGPLLLRAEVGARPARSTRTGRNEVVPTLDEQILADAAPVWERQEKMQLTYTVRNTHRAVGTRTSGEIVRRFGAEGLNTGHLRLRLRGSAGQSLGAFGARGLRIELVGDANDYVGKGLSGAELIVSSPPGEALSNPAVVGNTCLYGATSGTLFAAGRAGERFAVRNSGATAVIEGCGTNGCEYMTGGTVVILGRVGDNFAAGMTGGRAFVWDPEDRLENRLNTEHVIIAPLNSYEDECRALIEAHQKATGSIVAEAVLADWATAILQFKAILPKDVVLAPATQTTAAR